MIAHITEACDEGIEAISEGQSEKVSRGTRLMCERAAGMHRGLPWRGSGVSQKLQINISEQINTGTVVCTGYLLWST